MIGYVTLGTNDLERARAFYDALLGGIGATRIMQLPEEWGGLTMYGTGFDQPRIAITRPRDGKPHAVGNGHMTAIAVDDRAKVDALHAHALSLGGTCEGPPGVRGQEGPTAFYGAYFRDLDGNKLAAFRIGPPSA